MNRVFVIGNGLSRKDFDLTPLKKYGKDHCVLSLYNLC